MEAKTASHRSEEARHSRTVRWVIDRFEAVKDRVGTRAGALIDREQDWPEEAYDRGRPAAMRKRVSSWMEQAELWPAEPKRAEPTEAEMVMVGDEPQIDDYCVEDAFEDEFEDVVVPVKRERKQIFISAAPSVPVEKSRTLRVNKIVKFLKLNGAIHVSKPNEIYFDFPGRGHFQSLHLWKDSPEIREFTPNQF